MPKKIGSSVYGVDELAMLPKIETYINIGNDVTHGDKRILKFPHETFRFPWLITRRRNFASRCSMGALLLATSSLKPPCTIGMRSNLSISMILGSDIFGLPDEAGVNPDIIGECTLGSWEVKDDKGNVKKAMCLNNFHSRLYGFLKRFKNGKMTRKELATQVAVRVQEDFIGGYQGLNPLSTGHQTKHMLSNPDLAYGCILQEVFDKIGPDITNAVGNNRWTILSSVLYNLTEPQPNWYSGYCLFLYG